MKIAVDAMGGDFAPDAAVEGAILALRQAQGRFGITLLGQRERVAPLLEKHDMSGLDLTLIHTPEVIEMHDAASSAVKSKPNSSMVQGILLCKEGKAAGFVSAGNTGAQMAASLLVLGRIDGVQRPTIGSAFPSLTGSMMLFDVGANVDAKPEHLVQFAEMATIYTRLAYKHESPTVGLLNVGEEETKGSEALKLTHKLLREAHDAGRISFFGNVEGRDVLRGKVSIVLCDGLVGNILLKFGESVPAFLSDVFKPALMKKIQTGDLPPESAAMFGKLLKDTLQSFDDEETGGVPLLGINGISIICHGTSTPKAMMNAVFRAEEMATQRINEHIAEHIAKHLGRVSQGDREKIET